MSVWRKTNCLSSVYHRCHRVSIEWGSFDPCHRFGRSSKYSSRHQWQDRGSSPTMLKVVQQVIRACTGSGIFQSLRWLGQHPRHRSCVPLTSPGKMLVYDYVSATTTHVQHTFAIKNVNSLDKYSNTLIAKFSLPPHWILQFGILQLQDPTWIHTCRNIHGLQQRAMGTNFTDKNKCVKRFRQISRTWVQQWVKSPDSYLAFLFQIIVRNREWIGCPFGSRKTQIVLTSKYCLITTKSTTSVICCTHGARTANIAGRLA